MQIMKPELKFTTTKNRFHKFISPKSLKYLFSSFSTIKMSGLEVWLNRKKKTIKDEQELIIIQQSIEVTNKKNSLYNVNS